LAAGALEQLQLEEDEEEEGVSPVGCPMLFSGFVSHRRLLSALGDRLHSPLRALRGGEPSTLLVLMTGPGGVGGADVAVTALTAGTGGSGAGPAEETWQRPGGQQTSSPLPKLLAKASRVARGVVAAARAAAEQEAGGETRLRCDLMTLAVPVDHLAESILLAL